MFFFVFKIDARNRKSNTVCFVVFRLVNCRTRNENAASIQTGHFTGSTNTRLRRLLNGFVTRIDNDEAILLERLSPSCARQAVYERNSGIRRRTTVIRVADLSIGLAGSCLLSTVS